MWASPFMRTFFCPLDGGVLLAAISCRQSVASSDEKTPFRFSFSRCYRLVFSYQAVIMLGVSAKGHRSAKRLPAALYRRRGFAGWPEGGYSDEEIV